MNPADLLASSRLFTHEAMNTTFSMRLLGVDEATAKSVAKEIFYQIDVLEAQLSRFMEGSEVSRINTMKAGETLYLSEPCHQCLLLALDAYVQTHGLFDITMGSRIEHRKSGEAGPVPKIEGRLTIHPDIPAITCEEVGRQIDLGGIGKGFALDQIRQFLIDWEVNDALLSAGASSWLAHGPESWPVELIGEQGRSSIGLKNQCLSASGVSIQGSHIIHPWGDDAMPDHPNRKVWVVASSAALAEVWSTALMLVDAGEIPDALAEVSEIQRVWVDRGGSVQAVI